MLVMAVTTAKLVVLSFACLKHNNDYKNSGDNTLIVLNDFDNIIMY